MERNIDCKKKLAQVQFDLSSALELLREVPKLGSKFPTFLKNALHELLESSFVLATGLDLVSTTNFCIQSSNNVCIVFAWSLIMTYEYPTSEVASATAAACCGAFARFTAFSRPSKLGFGIAAPVSSWQKQRTEGCNQVGRPRWEKILTTQPKRLTILSSAAQLRLGLFLGSGSAFTGLDMVLSNAIILVGPGRPGISNSKSDGWDQKESQDWNSE